MFGTIIRHLLDNKLTTMKEMEEITGRGSSTIYRWMNGESEPHHTDMRLLIRHIGSDEARRIIVSMLTSDLPIIVKWVEPEASDEAGDESDTLGGHEVLERSLLALDCLTHALSAGNDALRRKELTKESYIKLITLVDDTIRHLTASKNLLKKYAPLS